MIGEAFDLIVPPSKAEQKALAVAKKAWVTELQRRGP